MRGKKKLRGNYFKKGNTFGFIREHDIGVSPSTSSGSSGTYTPIYNRTAQQVPEISSQEQSATTRRYDEPFFKKVAVEGKNPNIPIAIPASDGSQGSARILRPRRQRPQAPEPNAQQSPDYLFVHKDKLMDLFNHTYRQHAEKSPNCDHFNANISEYLPWGMCCRLRMECSSCGYHSERRKMYECIESQGRGAKGAKPNLGLQFGLQDSPIGNERARLILGSMGIRPGCRSSMQKRTNRAGDITKAVCSDDLRERIHEIKEVNKARGLGENAPLVAEFDVRYGGARMNTSYRPGQGAPEGTGLLIENVTPGKSIIGVYVENRLCYKGAWLRKNGEDVTCPGHEGCTATIGCADLISEKKIALEIGRHLTQVHNVMISHLTTDSDARGPHGFEEAMQEVVPKWEVTFSKDLTHMNQSQRRAIANLKFSDDMFRHIHPAPIKKKAQEALAKDVATRCAICHKKLHQYVAGDHQKMIDNAYRVVDCILDCYRGDHQKCKNSVYSFTCKGKEGHTWFNTSYHLSGLGIEYFNPTDEDIVKLRKVVHMTLGKEGIQSTKRRTTTSACESRNAGLSVSVPRNRRHARNVVARVHSAVLRMNCGTKASMKKKMAAGKCTIPENSPAVAVFVEQDKRLKYTVDYKRRPEVRAHQMFLRRQRIKQYYNGVKARTNEVEYCKFQLDKAVQLKKKLKRRCKNALRRHMSHRKPNSITFLAAREKVKKARRVLRDAEKTKAETKEKNCRINAARRRAQKADHLYSKKRVLC